MVDQKPSWMTHRDWFVKKLAKSLNFPESLVDGVIKHQFDGAIVAMRTKDSVEISGMGKFLFKRAAAQRKLDRMDINIREYRNKISNSDSKVLIERWNDIIDEILIRRQILINRMNNEFDADLRRLEKPSIAKRGIEESDRGDSKSED
jgi:nucleoid DNA-binding protein